MLTSSYLKARDLEPRVLLPHLNLLHLVLVLSGGRRSGEENEKTAGYLRFFGRQIELVLTDTEKKDRWLDYSFYAHLLKTYQKARYARDEVFALLKLSVNGNFKRFQEVVAECSKKQALPREIMRLAVLSADR